MLNYSLPFLLWLFILFKCSTETLIKYGRIWDWNFCQYIKYIINIYNIIYNSLNMFLKRFYSLEIYFFVLYKNNEAYGKGDKLAVLWRRYLNHLYSIQPQGCFSVVSHGERALSLFLAVCGWMLYKIRLCFHSSIITSNSLNL